MPDHPEPPCRHDVQKLLFLGSSCIYPRHAAQPMREEAMLTGPLEAGLKDAYEWFTQRAA